MTSEEAVKFAAVAANLVIVRRVVDMVKELRGSVYTEPNEDGVREIVVFQNGAVLTKGASWSEVYENITVRFTEFRLRGLGV